MCGVSQCAVTSNALAHEFSELSEELGLLGEDGEPCNFEEEEEEHHDEEEEEGHEDEDEDHDHMGMLPLEWVLSMRSHDDQIDQSALSFGQYFQA